jgi:hypothetical protein
MSTDVEEVDNLAALKRSVSAAIEQAPGYAEANANFGQFANRFRPEPNDEAAKFTREIDRGGQQPDGTLNRGATPPSETDGPLLERPREGAGAHPRDGRCAGGSSRERGNTRLLSGELRHVGPQSRWDGQTIRANSWARSHVDILAQFPAIRGEFDELLATARRGEQRSAQARADLDALTPPTLKSTGP